MEKLILAVQLARDAVSLFKTLLKDTVPNSTQKEIVEKKFQEAERNFQIAEAEAAQNLGYSICRCTWPPQIMLDTSKEEKEAIFVCPKCKKTEKIVGLIDDDQIDYLRQR